MEVKCNFNPNYSKFSHIPPKPQGIQFYGKPINAIEELTKSADIFVKRPVAVESATGLLSIRQITKNIISKIVSERYIPHNQPAVNLILGVALSSVGAGISA